MGLGTGKIGDLLKAARTGTSVKMAAEFLTFRFPFSYLYNSCISFLFCLKVCEYEELEAFFSELHDDWNDLYSNVPIPKLKFSHLFLKTTVEKWPGGCIPTCSDCICN